MVKASASKEADLGFNSHMHLNFSGSSHISDLKIGIPMLPCQVPGIVGSVLGLVVPASVCDWVR